MSEVLCPYCDMMTEINTDDLPNNGDTPVEQTCELCGLAFVTTFEVDIVFTPRAAPCLNGEPHDWKSVHGYPPEHFKDMKRCKHCGITRRD